MRAPRRVRRAQDGVKGDGMTTESLILTSVADGVGTMRLNRPEKRNAINSAVAWSMHQAMAQLDADDSVIVIVVEGSGGSFCAGADMTEALAEFEANERRFNPAAQATARVAASPKPTIGAIDGPAYGAGALLAAGCDIRIITERSRFRFPGTDYGLVVGARVLPQIVGGPIAKELLFTSRVVEAEEAVRIGLANRMVADAEALSAAVAELAQQIAQGSPLSLGWTKRVVNAAISGGDARGLETQADMLLRGGADNLTRFAAATERVTKKKSRS